MCPRVGTTGLSNKPALSTTSCKLTHHSNQPRPIGIFFPLTKPVPFWAGKRQKDDPLGMWAEELPLKRSAAMRPFYFPSCILPPPQDKKNGAGRCLPAPGGGVKTELISCCAQWHWSGRSASLQSQSITLSYLCLPLFEQHGAQ